MKDYGNRDLSFIEFNKRVLSEAENKNNPILERLNFLKITLKNQDEFFMARMGKSLSPARFKAIKKRIDEFDGLRQKSYKEICEELREKGIFIKSPKELTRYEREYAENYYTKNIYPTLTCNMTEKTGSFPYIASGSFYFAVKLKRKKGGYRFAVVSVPDGVRGVIRLCPEDGENIFVDALLLIEKNMHHLFKPHKIIACEPFRIIRNAEVYTDMRAEDFASEVRRSVSNRKKGKVVRVELRENCDRDVENFLLRELNGEMDRVYKIKDFSDIEKAADTLIAQCDDTHRYKEQKSAPPVFKAKDAFDTIRENDILICHPYDSFQNVTEFLKAATEDKNVIAIRQTLYRVGGASPVIDLLIRAARAGKQVTVLVELMAKFDEENNVEWAERLKRGGCNVIYGISGLKTHCKILSVIRKEADGIKTYLHMSTGNYNEKTAKAYTDISLFTSNEDLGMDSAQLFNMLTGYVKRPKFKKLVTAPDYMRGFLRDRIEKEIMYAENGEKSGIFIKINSLTDTKMISLLYKASQSGVPVTLIVRGVCRLIPNRTGLSENIRVFSIVGRYLEHSRIFKFENGGDKKLYLGSADLMARNLDRRVELMFPVEEERSRQRLEEIISMLLSDNVNLRVMKEDGTYEMYERAEGEVPIDSHKFLFEHAKSFSQKKKEKVLLS